AVRAGRGRSAPPRPRAERRRRQPTGLDPGPGAPGGRGPAPPRAAGHRPAAADRLLPRSAPSARPAGARPADAEQRPHPQGPTPNRALPATAGVILLDVSEPAWCDQAIPPGRATYLPGRSPPCDGALQRQLEDQPFDGWAC